MGFREYLKSAMQEEVIRKDKDYCELELKDGNNLFIQHRNGKYIMNCTKPVFALCKEELHELAEMLKNIN